MDAYTASVQRSTVHDAQVEVAVTVETFPTCEGVHAGVRRIWLGNIEVNPRGLSSRQWLKRFRDEGWTVKMSKVITRRGVSLVVYRLQHAASSKRLPNQH